jgi:hypothetical protein
VGQGGVGGTCNTVWVAAAEGWYGGAVAGRASRPLLFLDVDGPLIPFGGAPQQYPACQMALAPEAGANPLLARINPEHGLRLRALACELVWASTWMADANQYIAPRLGLPRLAVVTWPEVSAAEEEQDERRGLHWKTRALVRWAAGRAFAWVDDEITSTDRSWVAVHHPGQALLHRVDPGRGLADADYLILSQWLSRAGLGHEPGS